MKNNYIKKRIYRIVCPLFVPFLLFLLLSPLAFAEDEKAESLQTTMPAVSPELTSAPLPTRAPYLEAGLYSSVSSFTHSISWIDEIKANTDCRVEPENFRDFIYGVDPETSFQQFAETAERRELVFIEHKSTIKKLGKDRGVRLKAKKTSVYLRPDSKKRGVKKQS